MSERKPRIDFEGRTRLETVIPLSTPYLVFLDPSDKCNAKCKWCPTGSGEALKHKKPQLMDFLLYKKIINDLCAMPEPIKTLRLYKDGEPLLNPDLHKMVRYAVDSGRFGQVDTTTNGILLTPKRAIWLISAGLSKIFVSVPPDYSDKYRDQLQNFIAHRGSCKVYVKTIGDDMTMTEKETFFIDFSDADRVFIENKAPCWPEFDAGKVGKKGIYQQPLADAPKICAYIFYSLAINSNGTVSLCFLDWQHDYILGDLKKQSFTEIWLGERLKTIQLTHLMPRREFYSKCRNCQQLVYGAPDSIDAYADELLKRIS